MRYSRSKNVFLAFLIAIAVAVFGLAIYISIDGLSDSISNADAIVIFGNTVNSDGTPSTRLKARLDKAIQLFQEGYSPVIIVSGGIEVNGFDEAEVMEAYLLQNGIPEVSIYSDNQGNDTFNTARNTVSLMQNKNWNSIIIVSQFFHIARAKLAFRCFGISDIYSAHADYFELRDFYSLGREVIALLAYSVRKYK